MLIPSIDLMNGQIVQLVQGGKLKLAFDDFEYWIERFSKYPIVQLIDLDAAMRQGNNRALIDYISYLPVGSKINVTVIRNGKRQTLNASTVERYWPSLRRAPNSNASISTR